MKKRWINFYCVYLLLLLQTPTADRAAEATKLGFQGRWLGEGSKTQNHEKAGPLGRRTKPDDGLEEWGFGRLNNMLPGGNPLRRLACLRAFVRNTHRHAGAGLREYVGYLIFGTKSMK
jgi:hypothetical protein